MDPEYDTPGIFTQYVTDRGIDTSNFTFLSGPVSVIEDLKKQLGIFAEKDTSVIIKHTLMTVIFNPENKIIHQVAGSSWSPDDIWGRILGDSNR